MSNIVHSDRDRGSYEMLMATLLARMPDLRRRAQTMHVADHNWCCRECGNQVQWPCDVYQIATEAERLANLPVGHRQRPALPTPRRGAAAGLANSYQ